MSQDKQGVWCILMQCDIQKTLNKARNKLEKTEENEIYQRVLVATGDLLPEEQLEPASIKKFIVLSRENSEEEKTTMCESNTTSTTQITVTIHIKEFGEYVMKHADDSRHRRSTRGEDMSTVSTKIENGS